MKIAVEGCCHGELDKIYETIGYLEKKEGIKVDLLLCCGDFQAVRNEGDMKCMAVPPKYRQMQTFYKYYSGEKKAPVLTIFIGGNHEASNHLQELPYGGWVAPNIYYLGYAGIVRYKGVRIGGLSGIFKSHDYAKGHYEFPPYSQETLRSVYHVRNIDVFKLKQIRMPVDVFMTHDWPRGVYDCGDVEQLFRKKPFLREEVETGTLGSPPAAELLHHLQPAYWFSAHLHVKFAALMQHQAKGNAAPKITRFLSLDKCLPYRDFLQVVDVADRPDSSEQLEYDPEWLAILKSTDSLQKPLPQFWHPPENNGSAPKDYVASEDAMMEVVSDFSGELAIPENFSATVPAYDPSRPQRQAAPSYSVNPQTTELCATLGLTDIYALAGQGRNSPATAEHKGGEEEEEEDEDNRSVGSTDEPSEYPTPDASLMSGSFNPDEITIEEEWDEEEEGGEEDVAVPRGNFRKGEESGRLTLPPPPPHHAEPKTDAPLSPPPRSLNLPPPSASSPPLTASSQTSSEEEGGNAVPGRGPKRTSGETKLPPSPTCGAPKIKRRNQTIYAAAEDEES